MKKQQENIKHLLNLIQENPDLEIFPMVNADCVPSDDFGWWMATWGKATIDEYWLNDERCYIRSTDEDELFDNYYDEVEYDCSDEEANKIAQERLNKITWTKVICIKIQPY